MISLLILFLWSLLLLLLLWYVALILVMRYFLRYISFYSLYHTFSPFPLFSFCFIAVFVFCWMFVNAKFPSISEAFILWCWQRWWWWWWWWWCDDAMMMMVVMVMMRWWWWWWCCSRCGGFATLTHSWDPVIRTVCVT